jgi:hypothetical protein
MDSSDPPTAAPQAPPHQALDVLSFFLLVNALARTLSTILDESGESGCPPFVTALTMFLAFLHLVC